MDGADLVILTHERQGLDAGYSLAAIADHCWRPAGLKVRVHQGTSPPPPGRAGILHVDLTVVPPGYLDLARHYPRLLNGRVADISKRRVAEGLVNPGDGYDGPVVVKTDLNHAGKAELALCGAGKSRLRRTLAAAALRLPGRWTGRLPRGEYQTFSRASAVPGWIWRQPGLVVQRLFEERRQGLFALNQWYFLGDADVVSTLLAPVPFVNMETVVHRLPLHDEVPDGLRERRRALGFDYGKFDYVVEGGRAWLLDANKTPHLAGDPPTLECMMTVHRRLASGLDAFLAR
jgi:hypothetical protein